MSIGETDANGVNHTPYGTDSGEENISEVMANATPSDTREGFIAAHTPTPRHVLGGGRIDASDGMVASVLNHPGASPNRDVYVQKANAAFIVRAVNSHDDLLAALKGVVAIADRKTVEFDAARAAIAKAEGKTP